jgi:hypothetical protein
MKFSSLLHAKIKEGFFDGPQIRKLMMDYDSFSDTMIEIEEDTLNAFKEVKLLGCNMSLKHQFLVSHLYFFPSNLGAVSEEKGEMFHYTLKDVEQRYQGRWYVNMMADTLGRLHVNTFPESTQELQEHKHSKGKSHREILTYISKEFNVSKLSTHVPCSLLAKLFPSVIYLSSLHA